MQYELTDNQKKRKKLINTFIYLSTKNPYEYRIKAATDKESNVWEISLFQRFHSPPPYHYSYWQKIHYIILERKNHFPWPWRKNASNSK